VVTFYTGSTTLDEAAVMTAATDKEATDRTAVEEAVTKTVAEEAMVKRTMEEATVKVAADEEAAAKRAAER
jgi:uncharacterized protein YdeI (YjbR/CyaY-like superfamily)